MDQYEQPTKQQLEQYLANRHLSHQPPPDIKEIRRQLGWNLIEADCRLFAAL